MYLMVIFCLFSDLNLLDWSASNILAVALGNSIYLWNAGTGQIEELLTLEGSDHVCSLAWIQGGGSHLAIGITNGTTELWDCDRTKRLRVSNIIKLNLSLILFFYYK